jgi:hypothetical protein
MKNVKGIAVCFAFVLLSVANAQAYSEYALSECTDTVDSSFTLELIPNAQAAGKMYNVCIEPNTLLSFNYYFYAYNALITMPMEEGNLWYYLIEGEPVEQSGYYEFLFDQGVLDWYGYPPTLFGFHLETLDEMFFDPYYGLLKIWDLKLTPPSAVPEPSTILLLGLGIITINRVRKFSKNC